MHLQSDLLEQSPSQQAVSSLRVDTLCTLVDDADADDAILASEFALDLNLVFTSLCQ